MDRASILLGDPAPPVESARTLLDLASAHILQGDVFSALELLNQALKQDPTLPDSHLGHSYALNCLGRFADALASAERALSLRPDWAEAHIARALLLPRLDRPAEALEACDHALRQVPDLPWLWRNRGVLLRSLRRPAEAIASHDRALALDPLDSLAWSYRANALRDLGQLEEALASFDRAISIVPDSADLHYNRGIVLRDLLRPAEAVSACDRAIALDPEHADAHWNKAELLILMGEFDRGWRMFERRWRSARYGRAFRDLGKPVWLGERDLSGGTLLISVDGGLGDVIQFSRYAPLLRGRCGKLILECQRALLPLLRESYPGLDITPYREAPPPFDCHCPVMSLPGVWAPLGPLPAALPYLRVPPTYLEKWRDRLGPKTQPRVGIVCSGDPDHANDRNRSMPMRFLEHLLLGGVEFHCLQKEIRESDRAAAQSLPLRLWDREITDMADTAALVSHMDLVISVDTSVAHLAGALAQSVWVLLPYAPEMRWMLERADSPWYPGVMRLFRQDASRQWQPLLERVRAELAALLCLPPVETAHRSSALA